MRIKVHPPAIWEAFYPISPADHAIASSLLVLLRRTHAGSSSEKRCASIFDAIYHANTNERTEESKILLGV